MAKPFKTLRDKMAPEARERAKARTQRMLLEMDLQELRENIGHLTQSEVAEILGATQAHVSKLERRPDMLLSTLRSYVEAMGGQLEVIARFPDRSVRIKSIAELAELR